MEQCLRTSRCRDGMLQTRVRGEQWHFLRTVCNCAGTKASGAKYVGNGLGVVSVNPYGCNAPATPLGTWNIDLNGLYSVSGIVMNAITIPTQGETAALPEPADRVFIAELSALHACLFLPVDHIIEHNYVMVHDRGPRAGVSIQVRAAKTEADTSTWTGSNPICATVNLTTDNLGKMIKCSQTLLARYLTVIGTNLGGDGLPICSLDAIVTMPVPPNEAPSPSPGASGTVSPPVSDTTGAYSQSQMLGSWTCAAEGAAWQKHGDCLFG